MERQTISATRYRILMQTRPNVYAQRGGDTIVLDRLRDGLIERGHSVTVDLRGDADLSSFDLVHLFNFATVDLTTLFAERATAAGIPYVVTSLYEDIPTFQHQSYLVAISLMQYVQGGQQPDSFAISYQQLSAVAPARRFAADELVRNAAVIMPNGAGEAAALQRDFPSAQSIVTVPLGSEIGELCGPELFERTYGERDFVLCVGRLESRKNQLMLLKALEDSPLTVVLAAGGFSYQPEYEAAIRAFKRRGKTVILGRVDAQMLSSAYAACRIHVLPSWYELPGLVTLEAAARGKNIVVTRTGTTADYVGDRAFYCLPWDCDSVLSAVTAAYYSPAKQGLVEMAQSYSWAKTVEQTEAVYQGVVARGESVTMPKTVASQVEEKAATVGENSMSRETVNFEEIVERGEIAAKRADFAAADTYLAEAERISPNSTRVLKARGAVLLAQMKPAEARSFFDRALAMEPNEAKLLVGRGMCDLLQHRADLALPFFEQALALEPDYLVALYQILECAYSIGQYDRAIKAINAYLRVRPEDIEIRFCLAGCLFKDGQSDAAQKELDIVERYNPEHVGARELRQVMASGEYAASRSAVVAPTPQIVPTGSSGAALRASLSELSDRVRSWKVDANASTSKADPTPAQTAEVFSEEHVAQSIGRIEDLKRSGEFSAAIDELTKLVSRGALASPYREIADCLEAEFTVLTGDLATAGKMYDEILKRNSDCARALCGKGALAAEGQQWKLAEQYFTQALASDPDCDVAYAGMGICAMTENNIDKAFGFFQASTERNPENHRALLGLLQTGYPLKRYTEMERMLTAYLDLHPASLDMLYSFAGLLFAQGKVQEAKLEIEKILIFEPQHEHALELRGMIDQTASSDEPRQYSN